MSQIIQKETIAELLKGVESAAKVTGGVATELMNEAINLFIVESVLSILKFSVVFVIFFIVKKYLDVMTEASKDKEGLFKAFKTSALVVTLIYFTANSFPHLSEIGKALVAPNIYLAKKAKELAE